MKIVLFVGGIEIEIDLEAQALTATIPTEGQQGEIRVENVDPLVVRLNLPLQAPVVPGAVNEQI